MKKSIIIFLLVLIIVAFLLGGYILLKKNFGSNIEIMFITNNSQTIEKMYIKKGESVNLPVLEKEGYNFLGWYLGDEKVDNNYIFTKSSVLYAKWEEFYQLLVYCNDDHCVTEDYFNNDDNFDIDHKDGGIATKKPDKADYEKIYIPTKTEDAKLLGDEKKYILYDDNGLKIYFVDTKNVVNDDLKLQADKDSYKLYFNEKEDGIIGIGYVEDGYLGYYNIDKGLELYNKKYKTIEKSPSDLRQVNDHYISIQVFNAADNDVYLLSSDEEKEVLHDKTNNGSNYYRSYGSDGKYFFAIDVSTQKLDNLFKVYDNNVKPLFTGNGFQTKDYNSSEGYINYADESLFILDIKNRVVKKYNYNGDVISTSNKYNKPIYLINNLNNNNDFGNNYILYIKNNKLYLENTEDSKESQFIVDWKNNMFVGIHSFYTKVAANAIRKDSTYDEGIYVSVNVNNGLSYVATDYCYNKDKKLKSYPSKSIQAGQAAKPLIYIYPNKTMDIEVKLGNIKDVTTIYPKYNDSWLVKASPDGKLIDKNTGRELYGLYWEGKNYSAKVTNEGFVIKGEDTVSFLEEKLALLGLTEREAEEFIIYWLPRMEKNNYNYIRFADMEELNNYMPLEITPKPETLIRILMEFMPLEEKIDVQEQKLNKVERKGYTVVEWGGSVINK